MQSANNGTSKSSWTCLWLTYQDAVSTLRRNMDCTFLVWMRSGPPWGTHSPSLDEWAACKATHRLWTTGGTSILPNSWLSMPSHHPDEIYVNRPGHPKTTGWLYRPKDWLPKELYWPGPFEMSRGLHGAIRIVDCDSPYSSTVACTLHLTLLQARSQAMKTVRMRIRAYG